MLTQSAEPEPKLVYFSKTLKFPTHPEKMKSFVLSLFCLVVEAKFRKNHDEVDSKDDRVHLFDDVEIDLKVRLIRRLIKFIHLN